MDARNYDFLCVCVCVFFCFVCMYNTCFVLCCVLIVFCVCVCVCVCSGAEEDMVVKVVATVAVVVEVVAVVAVVLTHRGQEVVDRHHILGQDQLVVQEVEVGREEELVVVVVV